MALTYNSVILSMNQEVRCACYYGGIGYIGTEDGKVYSITMSTGAVRTLLGSFQEKIVAIATDNTTVFVGTDKGNIYGITIATGAVSGILAQVDKEIVAMIVSTYLFVIENSGRIKYYTIS